MRSLRWTLCFAALAPRALALPAAPWSPSQQLRRDVIVNVGDVTTVKKVATVASPTTVYIPYTVAGEATTIASVSTATTQITTEITATAV
ncbi:hypothetical protein JCM8202_000693 [Rhodotorula sphaerocarpa]